MDFQLFEFRWFDPKKPELQAVKDGRFARRFVQLGERISIEVTGARRCAGYRRDGAYKGCALGHPEGKAKCDKCAASEGSFVYTVFDGFNTAGIDERDLAKMQTPHWVYIALFHPTIIKIGVSADHRKLLRQIEQGSAYTIYLAHTPDGTTARQIETLSRNTGLADKIPSKKKLDYLIPEFTKDEAETAMRGIINELYPTAYDEHPHLREFMTPSAEVTQWSEFYGFDGITQSQIQYMKLQPGEWVSGRIVGMKGQLVVLDCDSDFVCVNMKDLKGYQINFANKPTGLRLNNAQQKSLF